MNATMIGKGSGCDKFEGIEIILVQISRGSKGSIIAGHRMRGRVFIGPGDSRACFDSQGGRGKFEAAYGDGAVAHIISAAVVGVCPIIAVFGAGYESNDRYQGE